MNRHGKALRDAMIRAER